MIDEGAVGLGHLAHGDAVGELAEGHGGVADVVFVAGGHEARKAKALREIVDGGLRAVGQDIHKLRGDGVARPFERVGDAEHAVVAVVVVARIPACAAQVDAAAVIDEGVRRDEPLVDGRGIGGQGLDGRAGRAHGAAVAEAVDRDGHGAVELKAARLDSDAAREREDTPVVGIHDDDGALELLAGAGFEVGQIRIDRIDHGLEIRVDAAVDLVAAVVEQGARRVIADALELHEIAQHVVDDDLFIIAVGAGDDGLAAGGAFEDQLLGAGGLVGFVVDVLLLVHLAQDRLLPALVVLFVIEGIVVGRHVGDADDRGGFGEREILDVLAEIGLCRGLHAVAALTEVDRVQVPLHDLLLVVLLLELQRAEDFTQLALDRHLVASGQVFDELLRDCRAAEVRLHLGEHLDEGAGGTVPVYALVLVKALVLNGDEGVLHIFGDILIIDPDALILPGERDELLIVPGGVLIPDRTRFAELIVLEGEIHLRGAKVLDVVGKDAGEEQPGDEQHQQDRTEELEHAAHDRGGRVHGEAGGLEELPSGGEVSVCWGTGSLAAGLGFHWQHLLLQENNNSIP